MNWFQQKSGKFFSDAVFKNGFILWFLLFPFDAHVLPVSLGFLTVYPYLILTFLLLLYSFFGHPFFLPVKSDNYVVLFFFSWAIYGLCFFPFVNGKSHAFYEIRSLILMAVTVCLVFRARSILKTEVFLSTLHNLSLFLFVLLCGFAFFEFFTGIHFAGKYTEKLWHLPASMVTYAPVFLYDNTNNFICYFFGLAVMVFLTDLKLNQKPLKMLLIVFALFFFSVVADSKFGKLLSYLVFFAFLFNALLSFNVWQYKKYFWWAGVSALCLFFCFVSKPLYFGPIWENGSHYAINSLDPVCYDDHYMYFYSPDVLVKKFGEEKVLAAYSKRSMRGAIPSTRLRENLLKNGYTLLRKSGFLGVGPGQYRWLHENKMMRYPITSQNGPHNSLMEILSQYGVFIFLGYIFILVFYWLRACRSAKRNWTYFITVSLCFVLFAGVGGMPSGFLILNIGWILTPLLLISASVYNEIPGNSFVASS